MFRVVDTNVPIVANAAANGNPDHYPEDCVHRCVEFLMRLKDSGIIVLDDSSLIVQEYMSHLSLSGQPGLGDAFMKWVFQNQHMQQHCAQVGIRPHPDLGFEEFPEDPGLTHFDPSDRKFVAVALASSLKPLIANAVDSDWLESKEALERNSVFVEELC